MRVLMFGWEFPPHIAGGLGTACYGIVKGLAYNGVDSIFVMPSASGDEDKSVDIINASDVAVDTVSTSVDEFLDRVKFVHIGTNMVPYVNPEEFSELVSSERKREVKDFRVQYGQKYRFSGKYGANLMEEVARYAMVGGTIAMQHRDEFDVIHAHDWLTYLAGIAAKELTGKPLVVHVHATSYDRGSEDQIDTRVLGIERRGMLAADKVVAEKMTIESKNWANGPKYAVPVFEFNPHTADGEEVAQGRYLIGEVAQPIGQLDKVLIEGISTKLKAVLTQEGSALYLDIQGMRDATDITWTGSESSVWNVAETENFTIGEENLFFVTGDNVHFDDSASRFTVELNGELEADTVFVDNTKAYTFNGSGSLVGNTTLMKLGTGTLNMKTENSYTGGNHLAGGVVVVTSLANANQPKGNLGGMTTTAAKFIMENAAELRTTAAVTNGSAIRFDGEEGGIINNSAEFTVDRAMSGTKLTKRGNGTMRLNVANANLQRLVVAAGTVQCINSNTPAKSVEFQGGTLRENTGTSYTVYIPEGKQGTWYLANRSTYTNKVTGKGTINIYCTTEKGTNYYATRTPVQCDFSEFEGTLKPNSSQDDPAVLRFTLNTAKGMPKGTMNIAEKVEVQNSGKTFRIGRVTGSGSLGGSCTFSNGSSVGANTWQVGNDDNWSFSGKVTSNANMAKVGSGRVSWSGSNDNTGTTNISEGELSLLTKGQLGTGALTVAAGATLSGATQKTTPLKNSSVTVNGTLRPGLVDGATSGILYFDNKNVTISTTGAFVIGAARCATATSNGCTSIDGVNKLTLNGIIRIVPSVDNTLQIGDSIRIFNAGSVEGNPTFEMLGGIEWDTTRISEGLLFVKDINTGIGNLISGKSPRNIYDMRGRLVRANAISTEGLPAGIYVCEGRKFVIK